jgi:flagellar hook-length control protein FliK
MPHAASIRSPQTQGAATADPKATDVEVRATPRDATVNDAAASNAALTAATPGAAGDQALSNAPGTADADAAAQAVMAAAVAQASAPANNSSASADDTITADGGISMPGMAAANDAPFAAPTAAHAPAAPPAIAAATAAAVVQAAQGAADAGAADRHSRGNSTDSSLSAATNDGAAGAAQLLTSNAPADAAPTPTFKIAAGVDTRDFGQGVADRVSLMMDGNLSTARLQVNPPALGPIEVRIALQAGHAQVWLSSHSAVTRDALESSAPKLREMLGSQGFAQVSVDISQRSFQERSPPSHAYEAGPAISDSPAILQASTVVSRAASGLLDAYA